MGNVLDINGIALINGLSHINKKLYSKNPSTAERILHEILVSPELTQKKIIEKLGFSNNKSGLAYMGTLKNYGLCELQRNKPPVLTADAKETYTSLFNEYDEEITNSFNSLEHGTKLRAALIDYLDLNQEISNVDLYFSFYNTLERYKKSMFKNSTEFYKIGILMFLTSRPLGIALLDKILGEHFTKDRFWIMTTDLRKKEYITVSPMTRKNTLLLTITDKGKEKYLETLDKFDIEIDKIVDTYLVTHSKTQLDDKLELVKIMMNLVQNDIIKKITFYP